MYLEEIIGDTQLESDKFESKAVLNREDIIGWLKSVAGFANASGGDFYIGVEDKTNKLIGFDRKAVDLDGKVLSFCYLKAHKVSEIAEYLGISDSTYFRKKVLNNLEKHGYLEKSKVSRATYYKTNPDMVRVE